MRWDAGLQLETARKVDWDEYVEDGPLTELHLIAIGLRNQDLEKHIQAHPEELEKCDVMGESPLWYASILGNLAGIRTLLKYGAILNEDTFQFSKFISRFGSKGFDFMDEHLTPSVLKSLLRNGWGHDWFLDAHTSPFDVNELLAVDELILERGFDVNNKGYDNETPLMAMVQNSHCGLPLRVKQLLDHGADLDLTDIYGNTALHHCIECYRNGDIDLQLLNMLVEHRARLDYRTRNGTTILHALILRVSQLEPIKTILHSDISGLLLDTKDSDGYTAFDVLILRARLLREDHGDCSVSLKASHLVDRIVECEKYDVVEILGKRMRRAKEPDMERKILTTFEALLHKVQEVQGIPPDEQYPSIKSVLDQEEIDAKASKLEGLPGSWPE